MSRKKLGVFVCLFAFLAPLPALGAPADRGLEGLSEGGLSAVLAWVSRIVETVVTWLDGSDSKAAAAGSGSEGDDPDPEAGIGASPDPLG